MKFLLSLFVISSLHIGVEALNTEESRRLGYFRNCLLQQIRNSSNFVARANNTEYNKLNYQWNQGPRPVVYPLAYLLVKNEVDVVAAIKCGKLSSTKLVAKGGGHSFEKYSFGNNNSVIIDLTHLNNIAVDTKRNRATVGAGVLLGPLYYTLWTAGEYFLPTGDCGTVGISGVATGGGFGLMSRKYGLTSDNILQFNIVTANGQLRKVNARSYPDLYWALRGGGGASFGVVTQFVVKIYKAPPKVFYGNLAYDLVQFPQVFADWQKFVSDKSVPDEVYGIFIVQNKSVVLNFYDLGGSSASFDQIKTKFLAGGAEASETFSYENFMVYMATISSGETYNVPITKAEDLATLNRQSSIEVKVKMKSFYVSRAIGYEDILKLNEIIQRLPLNVIVIFDEYGGAVNRIDSRKTAFVHRKTLYLAFAYYGDVATEATDDNSIQYVRNFFDVGVNVFGSDASYQNYNDGDLKNYSQRYYGANLARLVKVKNKYDRKNYFSSPQSIPIKI